MISTPLQLEEYCSKIADEKILYLDTEFIREESYLPRLETIQVRAGDLIEIVDFPVIKDLEPLWRLLYDPLKIKVFHAGQQDLQLLFQSTGKKITNVFDTQIAAAMVGYGEQIGYGQLVKNVTDIALSKSQSYTAWGVRPLTPAQIEYAMDDVRHLPAIYENLQNRLIELGRLEWAQEEFEALENSATAPPTPLEEIYIRVRGSDNLERKELVVLRELASWRETEALHKNKLPQRMLRDELLINLSRRPAESLGDLRRMRGFPPNEVDRQGAGILEAIKKAKTVPPEQWPEKTKPRFADAQTQSIVALLQAFLRARAIEKELAWSLMSASAELEELAVKRDTIKPGELSVLSGWRYEIIGEDLLRLLNGELNISFDKNSSKVIIN